MPDSPMSKYECYHDASGSINELGRVLVVVGILSTAAKWQKCEREWNAVLDAFKVPYLHMKEFAHSTGPFAEWKGDEKKRSALLRSLVLALKRRVNKAFQVRIVPAAFETLNAEYKLAETWGNPYAFLVALNILRINKWVGSSGNISHYVEKGDSGQNRLFRIPASLLPNPPVILEKRPAQGPRLIVPFQAADLLAYESRLNIQRHLDQVPNRTRKSLLTFTDHIPLDRGYVDDEVLREACKSNPDAFPPRILG